MKKKLILIFGVILILTGCGDNQAYIKNKVLNEFKRNNIYSYFNAEGLKMIQEAGFKQYQQTIIVNGTDITLQLNFETGVNTIYLLGEEITNYVRDKNIPICDVIDKKAICNIAVSIEGNSIIIPSSGDIYIDKNFNRFPVMINNMKLDENYISSLQNSIVDNTKNNPLGGSENEFNLYRIEYNSLECEDVNIDYFTSLGLVNINSLDLTYIRDRHKGNSFRFSYGPTNINEENVTKGDVVIIELTNGGKNHE